MPHFKPANFLNTAKHEYLHLSHANAKIRVIKLVRDIPPKWTELASFLYQSVEEAEAKEHLMPTVKLKQNKAHVYYV